MAIKDFRNLLSTRQEKESPPEVVPVARPAAPAAMAMATPAPSENYLSLKQKLHLEIINRVDLVSLESLSEASLREEIARLVEIILAERPRQINAQERRMLVRDTQNEMLGLGPLEPLMADATVSDILVNSFNQIYVERAGKLEQTSVSFNDEKHLMRIIEKIVSRIGRRIDESSPMVDARLPDGSRVNAVIPPVALDGPMLSIRRFSVIPLTMGNLVNDYKSLTPDMALLLEGLARSKTNIIISGGTGSGKTTLLNIMSGYIPASERLITIEDAAELQLQQPHVIRLETRPANIEGKGEVTQRALVRNALRMRPDRIVIGEVRGAEALDMLQAMNTGHDGSLTTIHANTPRDAISRMENMVSMAGFNLPHQAVLQQIAAAIGVIIQVNRLPDGHRKIISIQEITGTEGDVVTMQEIFAFRQRGVDAQGKITGYFQATGIRPKFAERLKNSGITFAESMFDSVSRYE